MLATAHCYNSSHSSSSSASCSSCFPAPWTIETPPSGLPGELTELDGGGTGDVVDGEGEDVYVELEDDEDNGCD